MSVKKRRPIGLFALLYCAASSYSLAATPASISEEEVKVGKGKEINALLKGLEYGNERDLLQQVQWYNYFNNMPWGNFGNFAPSPIQPFRNCYVPPSWRNC